MNNKKQCFRCDKFDKYYVRGAKHFNGVGIGRCEKNQCDVGLHDGCEYFKLKRRFKPTKRMTQQCLNEILEQLSELRELLEAGDNDDEAL